MKLSLKLAYSTLTVPMINGDEYRLSVSREAVMNLSGYVGG